MTKPLDKAEAPTGTEAFDSDTCSDCTFATYRNGSIAGCGKKDKNVSCNLTSRNDGHTVSFRAIQDCRRIPAHRDLRLDKRQTLLSMSVAWELADDKTRDAMRRFALTTCSEAIDAIVTDDTRRIMKDNHG